MDSRSAPHVVVEPVTTRGDREPVAGQSHLFGNPVPAPDQGRAVSTVESNDIDLMHTVTANAIRCGYVLVGTSERVYARTSDRDDVARVPLRRRRRAPTAPSAVAGPWRDPARHLRRGLADRGVGAGAAADPVPARALGATSAALLVAPHLRPSIP
jgi:hypothetical protein